MRISLFRTAVWVGSLALAAGAAHAGIFQQQVAADPHGEVDVSNISGSIVISGWDKAAVSVTADLPSDTQRVKVTSSRGRTSVCVAYNDSDSCNSPGFFHHRSSVRLELHVPRDSQLEVSGVSADITSTGIAGGQRLNSVSGDIDAELGSGNDDVNSVTGDIKLRGNGEDGTLHVANVSGDLSAMNVAGELDARTVDGRLSAEISPARLVRLNTTSGDIGLSARLTSGGTIETETVSGDQKLEVSAPAGYSYEVQTLSGDIHDCFGQQPVRSEYGPGSHLDGTRAGGDAHVRAHSLSGDVSLCDH
jgi:DUF4097 and DUF4098 domain-containing protein YvlB